MMRPFSKKIKTSSQKGRNQRQTTSEECDQLNPDQQQCLSWNTIPPHVLREIYMNVPNNVDRCAMAQVCKAWNHGFYDAALWRKMIFGFYSRLGEELEIETGMDFIPGWNANKLGQVLPTYLEEIVILFKKHYQFSARIVGDFRKLCRKLLCASMKKLYIHDFRIFSLDEEIFTDLISTLKRLIRSQKSLETLFIEGAKFNPSTGLQFIEFLANVAGDTVSNLSLKEYFYYPYFAYREEEFVEVMQKFHRLNSIHVDYNMLCDDIIKFWAKSCPLLSYIHLFAEDDSPIRYDVISCEAWRGLLVAHPSLQVEFNAKVIDDSQPLLLMLSPFMPVSKMKWIGRETQTTPKAELIQLLRCVANYHTTIKELFVVTRGHFPKINNMFVQDILAECRKLRPFTCREFLRQPERKRFWRLSQTE